MEGSRADSVPSAPARLVMHRKRDAGLEVCRQPGRPTGISAGPIFICPSPPVHRRHGSDREALTDRDHRRIRTAQPPIRIVPHQFSHAAQVAIDKPGELETVARPDANAVEELGLGLAQPDWRAIKGQVSGPGIPVEPVAPRCLGEAPGEYERWRLEAVARGLRLLAVLYRGCPPATAGRSRRRGGLSGRAAVEARL